MLRVHVEIPPNTSEVGGRPLRPPLPLGPAGEISPPLNRKFVAVRAMTPAIPERDPSGKGAPVSPRAGDFLPPLVRQIRDPLALGRAAQSRKSASLTPRTKTADRVVPSICPYCAVGCGQKVYVKDELVVQIEGDPDSPISRGRLCPKGAASRGLVTSPTRLTKVRYRRPGGTAWEDLDLET